MAFAKCYFIRKMQQTIFRFFLNSLTCFCRSSRTLLQRKASFSNFAHGLLVCCLYNRLSNILTYSMLQLKLCAEVSSSNLLFQRVLNNKNWQPFLIKILFPANLSIVSHRVNFTSNKTAKQQKHNQSSIWKYVPQIKFYISMKSLEN